MKKILFIIAVLVAVSSQASAQDTHSLQINNGGAISIINGSLTGGTYTLGFPGTILTTPSPLTDGQVLIGKTGFAPVATTLTAGTGINITSGPGSIKIASSVGIGTGGFAYTKNPDPTATNALAGADVMMGLGTAGGGGTAITIANAARMLITVCGDVDNNTNNDGVELQIYYGTGAAPANGVAPPAGSTAVGSIVKYVGKNANSDRVPINLNGIGTGLTVGTTYWVDVAIGAIGGGSARVRDITVSAIEF
ncbi:MAG TPA: hypothetical protein VEW28_07440 [Candidatus Kapabacteria bacterium]|nr:hypothetical protein [Candidatus Kapabacteria bacterium]